MLQAIFRQEPMFTKGERRFWLYAFLVAITLTVLGVAVFGYILTPQIAYDAPVQVAGVVDAQPITGPTV